MALQLHQSDWLDINRINSLHRIAKDFKEAIFFAVDARTAFDSYIWLRNLLRYFYRRRSDCGTFPFYHLRISLFASFLEFLIPTFAFSEKKPKAIDFVPVTFPNKAYGNKS
jgi:hypothetical protein